MYVTKGDLARLERLAQDMPESVSRAVFLRYALMIGAVVAHRAMSELRPDVKALKVLNTILKTPAGRNLVKVALNEVDDEDLTELTE